MVLPFRRSRPPLHRRWALPARMAADTRTPLVRTLQRWITFPGGRRGARAPEAAFAGERTSTAMILALCDRSECGVERCAL